MNPYQFNLTCGICGGLMYGTFKHAAMEWDSRVLLVHRNPWVCQDNLARKARIDAERAKDPILRIREYANKVRRELGLKVPA